MNTAGLWMLVALGVLVVTTGLPVWALLIGVASVFAALGIATGDASLQVLSALPTRLVGLLEHDLLQAMPLYVFVGVLLQRVALADALFDTLARVAAPRGRIGTRATSVATLGVGALIAPMNGSVASSSALLARLAGQRLASLATAPAVALVSVAATIGVVVPPSLVLILLGDAMMRAHTEASHLPGYANAAERIVNTQDVLHAALVPAVLVLVGWGCVALFLGRRSAGLAAPHPSPHPRGEREQVAPLRAGKEKQAASPVSGEEEKVIGARTFVLAALAIVVILLLLGGVFVGKLLAVEAAATGGCLLTLGVLATRALDLRGWREVLLDTLALSGALFALLVGATTFSLVFRLFGTDVWLADALLSGATSPHLAAAAILAFTMLCASVLDAFEMIFVVVPIIAPVLVLRLGDAQQAAVLLLLVLQLSFLLPPLGYAVLMSRAHAARAGRSVGTRALLRALAPYLVVQLVVTAAVFFVPQLVHALDAPTAAADTAPVNDDDVVRQMEEMSKPQDTPEGAAPDAPPTPAK